MLGNPLLRVHFRTSLCLMSEMYAKAAFYSKDVKKEYINQNLTS